MKRVAGACMLLVLLSGCVSASFHTSGKLNTSDRRIALVSPDVELSVLNAGGITEPNAEWTKLAEKYLTESIREKFVTLNAELINNGNATGVSTADPKEVQLIKLHQAVGGTILRHQYFEFLRLPTKNGKFEWTLGPDAKYLKDKYGADYALFIFVRDSYTSAGRAAVIAIAAVLGVGIPGGVQIGFASLVDLNNGEIVWFNRLARAAGDLRTALASKETVSQLLKDFPE